MTYLAPSQGAGGEDDKGPRVQCGFSVALALITVPGRKAQHHRGCHRRWCCQDANRAETLGE